MLICEYVRHWSSKEVTQAIVYQNANYIALENNQLRSLKVKYFYHIRREYEQFQ